MIWLFLICCGCTAITSALETVGLVPVDTGVQDAASRVDAAGVDWLVGILSLRVLGADLANLVKGFRSKNNA